MPTFGSTTDVNGYANAVDKIVGGKYTCPETSRVTDITIRLYEPWNHHIKLAIYDSSKHLIATTEQISTIDQVGEYDATFSFASSDQPTISSGDYYLAGSADTTNGYNIGFMYGGTASSNDLSFESYTQSSDIAFPSTFNSSASYTNSLTIWATYVSTDIGVDVTTLPDTPESISLAEIPSVSTGSLTTVTFVSVSSERFT